MLALTQLPAHLIILALGTVAGTQPSVSAWQMVFSDPTLSFSQEGTEPREEQFAQVPTVDGR